MRERQIAMFLQYLNFEKRMSEHTSTAYFHDLEQFFNYLAGTYELFEPIAVKAIHIRSFIIHLNELHYKTTAIKRKISALKTFFKFLIKQGVLSVSPTLSVRIPKEQSLLPNYLEQNQSEKLFETIVYPEGFEGLTHQLILELLYQTGIRRFELINLKERDIDFFRDEIVVLGKRNKERAIPIGKDLKQLIKNYLKEKKENIVFSHENLLSLNSGKPLYDNYVYRVVKRYVNNEITTLNKRSPHILRHTFATQLTNNGAPISAIKELLGHSSLAATQIYTHMDIEHLRKVYQKAHPKA
ncbi:MAG TPA: tyrosine-type recombinase/integrase [Edaphocola sp.]|nr:tyrosine-type recombinase/integrase [Edaphocola sp.]